MYPASGRIGRESDVILIKLALQLAFTYISLYIPMVKEMPLTLFRDVSVYNCSITEQH